MAYDLLPRIKFEIVIPDSHEDLVIKSIIESSRTGEHGDGVIFVSQVDVAVNISTLERGDQAILQPDKQAAGAKSVPKGK